MVLRSMKPSLACFKEGYPWPRTAARSHGVPGTSADESAPNRTFCGSGRPPDSPPWPWGRLQWFLAGSPSAGADPGGAGLRGNRRPNYPAAVLNGAACDPARSPVVRLNMRDVSARTWAVARSTIIGPRSILTAAHCVDAEVTPFECGWASPPIQRSWRSHS